MSDYGDYRLSKAPPWAQAQMGSAWHQILGTVEDSISDLAKQAVKMRMPQNAPPDAMELIGEERGIPRSAADTDAVYGARLQAAWNDWYWAGTPTGLLRALYSAGYTSCALATELGQWHTLDANRNVVTSVVSSGFTLGAPNFWNCFSVVFLYPLVPWGGSPPGGSSSEANFIRGLIRKWKPAHAILTKIVLAGTGPLWGVPPDVAIWGLGGRVWGGGTTPTVWSP